MQLTQDAKPHQNQQLFILSFNVISMHAVAYGNLKLQVLAVYYNRVGDVST